MWFGRVLLLVAFSLHLARARVSRTLERSLDDGATSNLTVTFIRPRSNERIVVGAGPYLVQWTVSNSQPGTRVKGIEALIWSEDGASVVEAWTLVGSVDVGLEVGAVSWKWGWLEGLRNGPNKVSLRMTLDVGQSTYEYRSSSKFLLGRSPEVTGSSARVQSRLNIRAEDDNAASEKEEARKVQQFITIGISVGIGLFAILVVVLLYLILRRRKRHKLSDHAANPPKNPSVRKPTTVAPSEVSELTTAKKAPTVTAVTEHEEILPHNSIEIQGEAVLRSTSARFSIESFSNSGVEPYALSNELPGSPVSPLYELQEGTSMNTNRGYSAYYDYREPPASLFRIEEESRQRAIQ